MSDRLDDARLASDERIANLGASLAAAERERQGLLTEMSGVRSANEMLARRAAEAERRLVLAKEALERIASGWGGPLDTAMRLAREALATLDGEEGK